MLKEDISKKDLLNTKILDKISVLSSDFLKEIPAFIESIKDRVYHKENSYLHEIFVGVKGVGDKNYLLTFNEKFGSLNFSKFQLSKIPVFGLSKINEIVEFDPNGYELKGGLSKVSKSESSGILTDILQIMSAIVNENDESIDTRIMLPPKNETIKKFVTLKYDERLKCFFAIKTTIGDNDIGIASNYPLITDKELKIINEDVSKSKTRLKGELDRKYPNFKVAYSYVDDLKNVIERKTHIVNHNKTITKIIYDKNLELAIVGDVLGKQGSLDKYDEWIDSKSEVLYLTEQEKRLNQFVNYVYDNFNRIYSKNDLKQLVTEVINDSLS